MTFHTCPRNQGQIVEVSYAAPGNGQVVQRITDRSDSSVRYFVGDMDDDDTGDYWHSEPDAEFREVSEAELRRMLDADGIDW